MNESCDVIIIGGGVIGLTTAFYLAQSGATVTILERGEPGREASWAGAGIIPPGQPDRATSPIDRLRAESSQRFPHFSQMLREQTGIDNGYRVTGGIEFLPADQAEQLVKPWDEEGITYRRLSQPEAGQLEPELGRLPGLAYHLPEMAQVRNPRHLRALLAACRLLGVRVRDYAEVTGLVVRGGRVHGVRVGDAILTSSTVLLAAGAWSRHLLEPLGVSLPVHPVRGQIVLLRPATPIIRHIILVGKHYLVPRDDGRVLVGSTEEPEAGFEKRTTAQAIADLLGLALKWVPGLQRASVETSWAGLRPGSADGLPHLGAVPPYTGLFVAAGHYRAGIQLSLATGWHLSRLIRGQPAAELAAFRLDRPPTPMPSAFRS